MTPGLRTFLRHRLPAALTGLGLGFAIGWWARPAGDGVPRHSHDEGDFHAWMHDHLAITPEQEAILAPHEARFEAERGVLRERIEASGRELAEAIRSHPGAGPELDDALSRLNAAQGELQRATLGHFYTMKQHLSAEQAERMRLWTHDRLLHRH